MKKLTIAALTVATLSGCASAPTPYEICEQKNAMIQKEMPPEDMGNGYTFHGEMRCDLESMDLVVTGRKEIAPGFKKMVARLAIDLCKTSSVKNAHGMGIKRVAGVHKDEDGNVIFRRVVTVGVCEL